MFIRSRTFQSPRPVIRYCLRDNTTRQVRRVTDVRSRYLKLSGSHAEGHKNSIVSEMAFDEYGNDEMSRCFLAFGMQIERVESTGQLRDLELRDAMSKIFPFGVLLVRSARWVQWGKIRLANAAVQEASSAFWTRSGAVQMNTCQ